MSTMFYTPNHIIDPAAGSGGYILNVSTGAGKSKDMTDLLENPNFMGDPWALNELEKLKTERARLREALKMITTYTHSEGQCDNGHTPVFVAHTALQEV